MRPDADRARAGTRARRTFALKRAAPVAALAVALGLFAGAAAKSEPGVPVTYDFTPAGPGAGQLAPGSAGARPVAGTFRVTFRNDRKARPLFISGGNRGGSLTVTFQDMEGLESFAGGGGSDLLEIAETEGAFAAEGDPPGAAPVGEDEFACAEWLSERPRPRIGFKVKSVAGWALEAKSPGAAEGAVTEVYGVSLTGALVVGERRLEVRTPATVTITDAAAGTPAALEVRAGFSFRGERAGLTGDDAGEIRVSLVMRGVKAPEKAPGETLPEAGGQAGGPEVDLGLED